MIGSAYCFYKDKHLALDLVKGRAKGAFNVVLSVFIEAAIVFFVGYVFVYGGWKLTANATNVSSVMRIPFKFLYSILPHLRRVHHSGTGAEVCTALCGA